MLLPLVLVSCHNKKDDSTDANYMSGTLTFSIPDFVGKGETLILTPTGITTPASGIGYSWKPSWSSTSFRHPCRPSSSWYLWYCSMMASNCILFQMQEW